MNNNSTATVTLSIIEWEQFQTKLRKLQEIVDSKKIITFNTPYDGELHICTGDSAIHEIIKGLAYLLRQSNDDLKKRIAAEYEVITLNKKLQELQSAIPIKK